jgi:hypothetical protein
MAKTGQGICCAALLFALVSAAYGQDADTALRQAAEFFYEKIPEGRKVAVFDFNGGSPAEGEAFAEKLRGIFSNDGRLVCIERGPMLALIHEEQAYSDSGRVDEKAEIRVGHELGAQVIFSGGLVTESGGYRVTINAIDTETAARLGQYEGRIRIALTQRIGAYYRENGLFFIGLRAGLGAGMYTPGADILPGSYSGGKIEIPTTKLSPDFALQASIAPVRFFAVQAEAMLVMDGFTVAYTPPMRDREAVREITYLSLVTPVLGKFMFKPKLGNLTLLLQGYGGIYFTIPLTAMDAGGSAGTFSEPFQVPRGFTGGGGAGIKLGPGFVFLDLRYMADSGDTELTGTGKIHKRQRLSFSAGYEIKVF